MKDTLSHSGTFFNTRITRETKSKIRSQLGSSSTTLNRSKPGSSHPGERLLDAIEDDDTPRKSLLLSEPIDDGLSDFFGDNQQDTSPKEIPLEEMGCAAHSKSSIVPKRSKRAQLGLLKTNLEIQKIRTTKKQKAFLKLGTNAHETLTATTKFANSFLRKSPVASPNELSSIAHWEKLFRARGEEPFPTTYRKAILFISLMHHGGYPKSCRQYTNNVLKCALNAGASLISDAERNRITKALDHAEKVSAGDSDHLQAPPIFLQQIFATPVSLRPYFCIGFFFGLRPAEIMQLTGSHLKVIYRRRASATSDTRDKLITLQIHKIRQKNASKKCRELCVKCICSSFPADLTWACPCKCVRLIQRRPSLAIRAVTLTDSGLRRIHGIRVAAAISLLEGGTDINLICAHFRWTSAELFRMYTRCRGADRKGWVVVPSWL